MQSPLGDGHDNGVKRGQGKQAISDHGNEKVNPKHGRGNIGQHVLTGKQARQERTYGSKRQDQGLQAFQPGMEALNPVDQHGQPEHERQRSRETEAHVAPIEQFSIEHAPMQQHCRSKRQSFPDQNPLPRTGSRKAPACSPEMKAEKGVKSGG